MLVLTLDAKLYCKHSGFVSIDTKQALVTIEGRPVLVDNDPQGKAIKSCPNAPPMTPCIVTFAVQKGYSEFVRINGKRICLDTVTGLTDGSPPGFVKYEVRNPGQNFVSEISS